jgi:hypothetical protein
MLAANAGFHHSHGHFSGSLPNLSMPPRFPQAYEAHSNLSSSNMLLGALSGLAPQSFHQTYQQSALGKSMQSSGWSMPNYPLALAVGCPQPPAPQCLGVSLQTVFGQAASGVPAAPLGVASGARSLVLAAATQDSQAAGTIPARRQGAGQSIVLQKSMLQTEEGNEASASSATLASLAKAPGMQQNTKSQADLLAGCSVPPEANDIKGQVLKLSMTQAGSKYLQRQLIKGHPFVINLILEEIEEDIVRLMCDAYGNYLCSQAFQTCSIQQRKRLLERLSPRVAEVACDKRGTHALQALIGILSTPDEQKILTRSMKDHVIELCIDANGTHVVQRLLFCFSLPLNEFIYKSVIDRILDVAHHPYGLCVLKKCISHAEPLGNSKDILLQKLAENALDLVQSPYGNYAIQHALDEWGGPACTMLLQSLEGRVMQLSIQKFSSNVVEKMLCLAPVDLRRRFIDELIQSDNMSVLVSSNYGHYVVKRALQLAEPRQVRDLIDTINSNLEQLQNRRLRAKWEKVMSIGSDRLGDSRIIQSHPLTGVR